MFNEPYRTMAGWTILVACVIIGSFIGASCGTNTAAQVGLFLGGVVGIVLASFLCCCKRRK